MAQVSLEVGTEVDGHWRLERQLSGGTTSCVWEAENLRLEGRVAIKFLLQQHVGDDRARERFLREARTICKIRSPHIVQVLDQGVCHGMPYLVMELLEGEDLQRLLAREQKLSLAETASMVDQLCRALSRAHATGFVHRDVKPENVFVIHENDGGHFIKLLDFGIAKQMVDAQQALTPHDMVIGTAHYLSPEQIERPNALDPRADVWAVGALAYRMLLGKPAFDGESWRELCARILKAEFELPSDLRSDLPPELDGWFQNALQRDRAARFPTVAAASAALGRIARMHASGMQERPAGQWVAPPAAIVAIAKPAPRPRVRPGARSLGALIAAGLVSTALALWLVWGRGAAAPQPAPRVRAPAPMTAAPRVPVVEHVPPRVEPAPPPTAAQLVAPAPSVQAFSRPQRPALQETLRKKPGHAAISGK